MAPLPLHLTELGKVLDTDESLSLRSRTPSEFDDIHSIRAPVPRIVTELWVRKCTPLRGLAAGQRSHTSTSQRPTVHTIDRIHCPFHPSMGFT